MHKSKFESEAFGLNFYRARETFLINNTTQQQLDILKSNQVDVVKFAIDSRKYDLSNTFPAFSKTIFLNTVINYRKDTSVVEDFPIINDCELVNATINDKELISQLIVDVFGQSILGYSKIEFLKEIIKASQELYAIQTYLLDLLEKPNSGIQLYKSNINNEIIGFSSFEIKDDEIYRAYAGILPTFRNNQHYENLVYLMIRYNYEYKIKAITFGARADNLPLINKFSRVGCKVISIDYTYIAKV